MDFVPIRCHIPKLLHKIGKNQQWLADRTGISKQRISDYINLRIKNMRLATAIIIANTIGCRVEELFDWEWRHEE